MRIETELIEDLKFTRLNQKKQTIVPLGHMAVGEGFIVIAGPCAVESEKQTIETARAVKLAGADALRGGAFKPRSSPYSFQGLGLKGLKILKKAKEETGLPIVTEVLDTRDVDLVSKYADVIQIGSRNMQNFALLKEVGKTKKPILLKRGMNCTIEEWLYSAEYILSEGNPWVVLCERGMRTYETYTRNTLDLSAVPVIKSLTHLPIIIDPSHATGKASLVPPLCLAAVAVGAHGIIVEVHIDPKSALSDKEQALTPGEFSSMMGKLRRLQNFMDQIQ
ncbi:MAG TPA: 3-deoxy-7-phosphoheptulonate synthase [Syntrophorhabdaceae bacterium]|nr:3-deoxy-7-phosphoheptulonate synthase [Syntrophorhabdaceae bacterium]